MNEQMIRETERQIQDARAILAGPDTYRHRWAELELEKLETRLEGLQRNAELHKQRLAQIEADRQAAAKERQETLASQERAKIWQRYHLANPAASDADFERAFPQLLDDHRRQKMAQGDAAAREQMSRLVRRFGL
jgi:hypothetical protein